MDNRIRDMNLVAGNGPVNHSAERRSGMGVMVSRRFIGNSSDGLRLWRHWTRVRLGFTCARK